MARVVRELTLTLWPNKDAEPEEVRLGPEALLEVVQVWDRFVLVKDPEGRVFNLAREAVELP